MSPLRVYRCRVCNASEERVERWDDPGPQRCPYCRATAYHRVIHAPLFHVKGGGDARMVGGERPFTQERVVQNRDGSETRYKSLHEARRGEYERAAAVTPNGLAKTLLARSNARKLASGVMPGRASTKYREACEEAPPLMPLHVEVGVKGGVLTVINPDEGTSVSLPWPPPPPRDGYGSWQPALLERFPDGTAVGLWRWEVSAAPWQRADRPFNVPPWLQVLPPPGGARVEEVMQAREEWDGGVQERR